MKCTNCKGEKFYPVTRMIKNNINGQNISVFTEVSECHNCGEFNLNEDQAEMLLKNTLKILDEIAGI